VFSILSSTALVIEQLAERTHGFLSRTLSESFSLVSFIICLINVVLLVVVVVMCRQRRQSGHAASNLRQSAGIYSGGEEPTKDFGSINSKLSMVTTVSNHSDTDNLFINPGQQKIVL
jgi:hypothetical protein